MIWILLLAMGAVTFGLRLSFLGLLGERELPLWLRQALQLVPVAVLPALVAPELIYQDHHYLSVLNVRVLAAAIAALVAWRTRNVALTLALGMGAFWVLEALL